tara:strand:+ start:299 stop:697 length:399 start_codon:yes stop_codon:yes gene_type:complete
VDEDVFTVLPKNLNDDSMTCRIRIRNFLEENGYEIYEADSGISGLEVLKENSEIKFIFSDLNMPEMDGISFIERARNLKEFTDTPVVICTTEVCGITIEKAKELGVKAWMQKPLKLSNMLGVLKIVLPVPLG